jgi:hypothetical protein
LFEGIVQVVPPSLVRVGQTDFPIAFFSKNMARRILERLCIAFATLLPPPIGCIFLGTAQWYSNQRYTLKYT